MKILSVFLIILALFIIIFPQFNDCESQGRMLTLADGRQIPMKCHWTARAEVVVGLPLLVTGILLLFSKHNETRVSLSILGVIFGVSAMLLPTYLIGVCGSVDMVCNSIMKPALLLSGGVVILISLIIMITSIARKENVTSAD